MNQKLLKSHSDIGDLYSNLESRHPCCGNRSLSSISLQMTMYSELLSTRLGLPPIHLGHVFRRPGLNPCISTQTWQGTYSAVS